MTEALDGNAIAAELQRHFGVEMTGVSGVCRHCGASAAVAELRVYRSGPGDVARCPACGAVAIVVVEIRGSLRVDAAGFELAF